jgi:ribosomal protein S19E (S16A)
MTSYSQLSRLQHLQTILGLLNQQPHQRTPLTRAFTRKHHCSRSLFEYSFAFLKKHGFLYKESGERVAPYVISQRGRLLLDALNLVIVDMEVKP